LPVLPLPPGSSARAAVLPGTAGYCATAQSFPADSDGLSHSLLSPPHEQQPFDAGSAFSGHPEFMLYGVPLQPACANAWPAKKTGVRIHRTPPRAVRVRPSALATLAVMWSVRRGDVRQ
jgi:hypothetical protein